MNKFINLILVISISLHAALPAHAELSGVGPEINQFVKKHKNNWAAYDLTADEFKEILNDNGFQALYLKQVEKTILAAEGAQTSEEKLQEQLAQTQLNEEAYELVDRLFKQKSVEQMNLDLLQILHLYVINEDARGPLNVLLQQIEQYHFSAEQIHNLEKEATYLHQYSEGALYSFGALFVGALTCLKFNCQPLRNAVSKIWKTDAGRKAIQESEHALEKKSETLTWNELIDELEKLNVRSTNGASSVARSATEQVSTQVIQRKRLLTKLMSLNGDLNFRNFALVTGATVVGGSANIGWNALNRAFYKSDIKNTYLNPSDYKSDYFDAMAVARLSCRSFDLAEKANAIRELKLKNDDLQKLALAKELNALYVEYAILQRIALRYQEKVLLPAQFKADTTVGEIGFTIDAKGKTWSEKVSCAKVRGAELRGGRVEVNLGEVLFDLGRAYDHLKLP